MKDVATVFNDWSYLSPEKGLELAEKSSEEATLILAFTENIRECVRKLPDGLTQQQRKQIFVRAMEAVAIENLFFRESELISMGTELMPSILNYGISS